MIDRNFSLEQTVEATMPVTANCSTGVAAGVMARPPRRRQERLLSWPLLARAYLFLGPMQAIAALTASLVVLGAAGWSYGEPLARIDPVYPLATTACLVAIVVMQIANVFICRSPTLSVLTLGPFSNQLILVGISPRSRSSCSSSTSLSATRSWAPRHSPQSCGCCRCLSLSGCWPWKKRAS